MRLSLSLPFAVLLVVVTGCGEPSSDQLAGSGSEPAQTTTTGEALITTTTAPTTTSTARPDTPGSQVAAPETFYATRDRNGRPFPDRQPTEIVEVELATGQILRTIVDVGPYQEAKDPGSMSSPSIYGLALSPDRSTLYYSADIVGQHPARNSSAVYRVLLPDGEPEHVTEGRSTVISPDGRRLAYEQDDDIFIRELSTGKTSRLYDAEYFGTQPTDWSPDGKRLATFGCAADTCSAAQIDIATGKFIVLEPAEPSPFWMYYPYSPAYRSFDGMLGVICCHYYDPGPDPPEEGATFVLHDPAKGKEHERVALPFSASGVYFDASGHHQLFTRQSDGTVHRRSGEQFTPVPGSRGLWDIAW